MYSAKNPIVASARKPVTGSAACSVRVRVASWAMRQAVWMLKARPASSTGACREGHSAGKMGVHGTSRMPNRFQPQPKGSAITGKA